MKFIKGNGRLSAFDWLNPPDSNVKDKIAQMQREYGGVGVHM
jgi:hypothetical protein